MTTTTCAMKSLLYILNEQREPVAVEADDEGTAMWGKWYEKKENRRVGVTQVGTDRVSTVFLGVDHGWGDVAPVLWETMVFDGPHDGEMERCAGSWQDAEAMHARMVAKVSTPPTTGEQVADKFQ